MKPARAHRPRPQANERAAEAPVWWTTRQWPLKAVRRICRGAGVPVISAHGLRGTLATLAYEAGMAGKLVAATLGHGNERVTAQSYALPGVADAASAARGVRRLLKDGGDE